MRAGSQNVKRTWKSAVLVLGLGLLMMTPALAHARLSLEPSLERGETIAASSLSLPGNLSGGAALAFDEPMCRAEPGTPLLPASALSLPGEVIEDVLLAPAATPTAAR